MLPLQSLQPHSLLRTNEFWLRRFRQRQVVGSMSLSCCLHLSTSGKSLQPILPDRLEHHQAWLLVLLLALLHHALVDERGYPFERLPPLITQRFTDGLDCCK